MAELCFGCGQDNPIGLHIEYVYGSDDQTSTLLTLSDAYSGEPGIVHGGIQATILDEVIGRTVRRRVDQLANGSPPVVTASFELKYRSPCPVGTPIEARAAIETVEWPSVMAVGEIVDGDGNVLTEARARWRVLD